MLQFLTKLKLCTKLVSRQYMKAFASKFIYNNLCLFLNATVFSTTGASHWISGSSVKSITGVTFGGKCPWLMYMICQLIFCFPFFSVIVSLFDVTSFILKLKDLNCSNSFLPLPFIKLGHLNTVSHLIWKLWRDAYINNLRHK